MKNIRVAFCLLFLSLSSSLLFSQTPDVIKDKFDKVHNLTTRTINGDEALAFSGAKKVYFTPFYTFEGHAPKEFVEPELTISIVGAKDLGDQPDLMMQFSDKRDGPYSLTRIVNDSSGGESFQQFVLPWKARRLVRQIVSAMIVHGQIGQVEFGVTLSMVDRIKTLYSKMPKEQQGLDISYKKGDDLTKIYLTDAEGIRIKNARYFLFLPGFEYSGRAQTEAGTASILMLFVPRSAVEPEKTLDLKIWVDDKQVGPFTTVFVNTIKDDIGDQQVYGMKDKAASIIEAIANATNAKGSLGNIEFTISPESISQIKLLYKQMQKK